MIIIIICIVLVVLIIFGLLKAMYLEYKSFNKGICPKCGKHLIHFDTDLQGGRGYCCRKCNHFIWISYHWIDNKVIGRHYCSSRSFANYDLTATKDRIKALQEK